MTPILAVTRNLAAPFDLMTMLAAVIDAARQVLAADRATVWLYDAEADQLVLKVATEIEALRIPADLGLVGNCVRTRQIINVPDCYADSRFNPELDRRSNYRTRCMLTLPLIDHKDALVGVLQVLNKHDGVFDHDDEALAGALAAQCAVALQRVRMTEALIEGEKMRQQLELARAVQQNSLPAAMPSVPGYDVFGTFRPADLTGGDTFDLALIDQGLMVVLGDATGHGIGPALHVTQMHAMLRMAFRMGADLETAFMQVNNQLAANLPDDRFITAFIGIVDVDTNRLRFHSGGQAPILVFDAETGDSKCLGPTSFPLAALPLSNLREAVIVDLKPGDMLVLLSDGIYEYHNAESEQFGVDRVTDIVRAQRDASMAELSDALLAAVEAFANGAPQEDDITLVLVKRLGAVAEAHHAFPRSVDALHGIFDFTRSAFERLQINKELLPSVDLAIEELFTNAVKYSAKSGAAHDLALKRIAGGVEVTLIDHDVDFFDITQAPDADIHAPLAEREPGGLGLHLIRRMVDSVEYHYDQENRRSRTVFCKTVPETMASGKFGNADRQPATTGEVMLTIEKGANDTVVIAGRFDAARVPVAQQFLDGVSGVVTLDCTRLEYISSAGLGVLLKTQKRLLRDGGKLRLIGASPHLYDIFQFSGLDKVFDVQRAGE